MLRISPDLELPAEAVTQTFAILAKRGAGKTYTAKKICEQMLKAHLPVVILDPIGVWWGLRSGADGNSPGLEITIAGGDHGDFAITPENGEAVADLIIDEQIPLVIDLSHFRKNERIKFVTDFCETVYRRNRTALHIIADEADAFAPQRAMPDELRMLGAMEDLVRRGRARGIGMTMITQRPSVLNKNVLTQIEVLIALRLTAPLDQKAIDEWVKTNAEAGQREEFMASLPSLPVGTAWFWSPGWLKLFKKIKVSKIETLDSSSTPKVGDAKVEAKHMAEVDISAIKQRLAATIEQVKSEDPKELKKQIKTLKKMLADQDHQVVADPEPQHVYHQVEVLPKGFKARLDVLRESIEALGADIKRYAEASDTVSQFNDEQPAQAPDGAARPLKKAERMVLNVLAQYPGGRTLKQAAIITGYSHRGGGYRNAVSYLRSRGYIVDTGEMLEITGTGRAVMGDFEPLPEGKALVQFWAGQLKKAERMILETVVDRYPRAVPITTIANLTGYEVMGGGFRNALSKLRTLELIEGRQTIKASNVFFKEGDK